MTKWGPIIDHDGGACPIPAGTYARAWMSNGRRYEGVLTTPVGDGWCWDGPADPATLSHVLAYQLQRPRGVQMVVDALQQLGDAPRPQLVPT